MLQVSWKTHTLLRLTMILFFATPAWTADTVTKDEPAPAKGVRTDFGDVLIENLGIGKTYNLRELAGKPLKITNQGRETLNLLIDVHIPKESEMLPERRHLGFKPIQSIDWITISQSQFVVPSGESAFTDVLINIPNDPKLYGKKFQGSIYSRSTGKGFLQLGVWSHIFISIVPDTKTQSKVEESRKQGFVGTMDYTLLPDKLILKNIPIGRSLDISKEIKRTIKLANSGTSAVQLRVKVIPLGDSPLALQEGFEEPKDIKWLATSADSFTVEPDSFVDPGFILTLPNDKP